MSHSPRGMLLAGNGPCLNRGCQAIELGTVHVLRKAGYEGRVVVAPFGTEPAGACSVGGTDVVRLVGQGPCRRFGSAWWHRRLRGGRSPRESDFKRSFRWLDESLDSCDVVLSLGGDNYTLDYGEPAAFFAFNEYVKRKGARLALWGASVGPFGDDPGYVAHCAELLKRVDWILAREDETVEYLGTIGVTANVVRVSDPAFVMEPTRPEVEAIGDGDRIVGINVSPLFAGFTASGASWSSVCVDLIRTVVDQLGMDVLLVPHVTVPGTDDRAFMDELQTQVGREGRVRITPDGLSAPEIKWVIGKCRAFVGTRMHSTVASLSMGVPTLSLAYSHKAAGINRDVFGHTDYVVWAKDASAKRIAAGLGEVLEEHDEIASQLRSAIAPIMARAEAAGRIVLQGLSDG